MRIDRPPLTAITFEPDATGAQGWRAARTTRALKRLGLTSATAIGAHSLASMLAAQEGPTWIVRAGAVPIGTPRLPPASATGRSLLAFGATAGDARWAEILAATGGDLSRAPGEKVALHSVVIEKPALAAKALVSDIVHGSLEITADPRLRAVRIPAFDVAFTEAPHVVQLVTTLHRGGAERIVLDLVRELDAIGVDVTLAVLDHASRTTFDAPAGTVFLDEVTPERRERLLAASDMAIARGADLVHAHLLNGDDLRVLATSGVPLVTTIHNSQPGWPVRLEAVQAGDLALVIACSRDVERQWEASGISGVARTAWNGITKVDAKADPKAKADPNAIRMLAIANHRPQKRLERLPTLVAGLRSRGFDAQLDIVGEPVKSDPEMLAVDAAVKREAERLGVGDVIRMVGSRDDVASLYSACDVVVSTAAFEGLSLVHLEALAAGVPIVTSMVAGTEELVAKHPHAHAVSQTASPVRFADTILTALAGRRALDAAPTLAPDFTSRKMAERHAELFSRVLATSSRRSARQRRGGVVLVANNFSTGGAQSSARRLLTTLAASGTPVRAVVIQEQAAFPTPGRAALEAAGIDVFVAPRAGDVDPLVTARAVARFVDEAEPDALLFWNVISQHKVLIADLLLDTPIWDVSPGEMYFTSFEKYFEKPRVASPYLSMRDYGRRLAGVIVKYEAERIRAEESLGARVHVVPNGVVVPAEPGVRPNPSASGCEGERIVIGTLVRLCVDKKLEQLVDAVADAVARDMFTACELRIAGSVETGDEAYVERLKERARGLPITWVGEQDSAKFLAELDLFAMVSEPSGCPNASIEAMAAGLAVVATNVGGVREQIDQGVTGLLVPRGDAAALGEAIIELARNPERRLAMGRAGHARARDRFEVTRMAADYARICLDARRASRPVLELADDGLGAQLPNDADRLDENLPAHLGGAGGAVDEDNRNLDDAHALADRPVGHLDLERVAVRVDGVDVDGLERAP